MSRALVLIALAGCASSEAAPEAADRAAQLAPVAGELCATHGRVAIGAAVDEPTVRAYARATGGDAAALTFVYRGETDGQRALASGAARRQLGLKLRARDGCNVVYVMWRLDPRPKLEVSVKRNPGARAHEECGADGYTKVKPARAWPLPSLEAGDRHALRAAIAGDVLTAWIDDAVVWRGTLPAAARALEGPAGLRSDNLAYDLVAFEATAGDPRAPACKTDAHAD